MDTVHVVVIATAVVVFIGLLLLLRHEDRKMDRVYRDAYRKLDKIRTQEYLALKGMASEMPRKGAFGHKRSDIHDS